MLKSVRDSKAGGDAHLCAAEAGSGRLASVDCEAGKRGLATVTESLTLRKLKQPHLREVVLVYVKVCKGFKYLD